MAATATAGSIVLCGMGGAVQFNVATADLGWLAQALALQNAPLCLCVLAWGILVADATIGYPPTKVQYATLILFFGTVVGVFSSLASLDVGWALVVRLLSL